MSKELEALERILEIKVKSTGVWTPPIKYMIEWNYDLKNTNPDMLLLKQALAEQEKKDKLLELYRGFIEELKIDVFCECFNEENGEYNELEYLDIGGATDKSIELFKQIKALEEALK